MIFRAFFYYQKKKCIQFCIDLLLDNSEKIKSKYEMQPSPKKILYYYYTIYTVSTKSHQVIVISDVLV